MSDRQNYIIVITKQDALFPQNWDEQNYFDYRDNFDVFFNGELSEEELSDKFHEAIRYVIDNFGDGNDFRPVLIYNAEGEFVSIEGSSNLKLLRYRQNLLCKRKATNENYC